MELFGTARINDQGHLEIGGCDTVRLVQRFGTPLYVMDETLVRANMRAYRTALEQNYPKGRIIYASKAFLCAAMARVADEEGLGLDVVSGGELYTAIQAGFPADRIYFHGNNKTADEIALALDARVGRLIADSRYDLQLIADVAKRKKVKAKVLLRVTPGIEAHTHEYIRTGQLDSKFGEGIENGLALEAVREALSLRHIELKGLHCHIGSQIFDPEPFAGAAQVLMQFARKLYEEFDLTIEELNLGGGLGVRYMPDDDPPPIADVVARMAATLKAAAQEVDRPLPMLLFEPGRSIVGEAGTTLYTVGSIKHIPGIRTYLAVDGGMGDNPRPALYQAKYQAAIANKMEQPAQTRVTVAGKYCESGDILLRDVDLAKPESGDILAVFTTGAYNYSMAMNYNRIPRPAVVFVRDGDADLVVARESYEDIIRNDRIPERLRPSKAAR